MEDDEIITINARAKGPRRPRGSTGPKQSRQTNGDDDTDWVKTEKSKQDEINSDPELVQQKLEDFEQILPEEYVKMQTGTFIRYLTFDDQQKPQLRLGGYLIKNAAPEYWVLKCGGKGKRQVTWSVPLQPRPDRPSNVYYRRKGVLHCKEDKIRYGAEMYECVASGRKILVDPNEIEKMSGQKFLVVTNHEKADQKFSYNEKTTFLRSANNNNNHANKNLYNRVPSNFHDQHHRHQHHRDRHNNQHHRHRDHERHNNQCRYHRHVPHKMCRPHPD